MTPVQSQSDPKETPVQSQNDPRVTAQSRSSDPIRRDMTPPVSLCAVGRTDARHLEKRLCEKGFSVAQAFNATGFAAGALHL